MEEFQKQTYTEKEGEAERDNEQPQTGSTNTGSTSIRYAVFKLIKTKLPNGRCTVLNHMVKTRKAITVIHLPGVKRPW